jgi:hypothetical protein
MVTAFWIFLKSPIATWSKASCSDEPEPLRVAAASLVGFEAEPVAALAVPIARTGRASAATRSRARVMEPHEGVLRNGRWMTVDVVAAERMDRG